VTKKRHEEDDNCNEEAATRIVWFEEGKLDLYLASRTTCWVGLSLRREFSVLCGLPDCFCDVA